MTKIPKITDPLGRHWDQPNPEEIELTEEEARMSAEALKRLAEYNSSIPSGVYEGKMWKRKGGRTEMDYALPDYVTDAPANWYLCWFAEHPPGTMTVFWRKIVLI